MKKILFLCSCSTEIRVRKERSITGNMRLPNTRSISIFNKALIVLREGRREEKRSSERFIPCGLHESSKTGMECGKSEEGVDKREGEGCVIEIMVAIEDGDALVPLKEDSIRDCGQTVMERCLDQPRKYMLNVLTFCLAMGNAADAVEIMCIGFIMTELNLSSEEKGNFK